MKKKFYTLLFMAVALFSAATMVSCSNDDEPEPEPIPQAQNYARYTARINEQVFEYFDVSVTVEVDGKKDVYLFEEKTKVGDIKVNWDLVAFDTNKAGRVLEIPVFKYEAYPVRFVTDLKLTEAGKQKIAKEPTKEMDFIMDLYFGKCKGDGVINEYHPDEYVHDFIKGGGIMLKDLEDWLSINNEYHAKNFDKTFK